MNINWENIILVIITMIISPFLMEVAKYFFSLLNKTKDRDDKKTASQDSKIEALRNSIDELKMMHEKRIEDMRLGNDKRIEDIRLMYERRIDEISIRLSSEIQSLRDSNVQLQIKVAEQAIREQMKDEKIDFLNELLKHKDQ